MYMYMCTCLGLGACTPVDTSRHAPVHVLYVHVYIHVYKLFAARTCTLTMCVLYERSRISFLPPLLSGVHSQQAECVLVCVCPCLPLQSDPPVTDLPVARKEGMGRKGREGAGRKGGGVVGTSREGGKGGGREEGKEERKGKKGGKEGKGQVGREGRDRQGGREGREEGKREGRE